MKKIIAGILCCLLAVFVMSHNSYAFSPTQSLRTRYSIILSHNNNANMIINNGDASDGNAVQYFPTPFQITFNNAYVQDGEILDITLVLANKTHNNSTDISMLLNDLRCNNWAINCMLLGYDAEEVTSSMGIIHIYVQVNVTSSNLNTIQLFFDSPTSRLYGQEYVSAQNIVIYHQTGYDLSSGFSSLHTDLQAINSALASQTTYLSALLDNSYTNFQFYGGFNQRLNTIIDSLSSLDDIADSTQNVSDYVDEQREAYENMQDTDGLIDIGNQTQALGLVGSFNSFFGAISAQNVGNCIFDLDFGNVDLGEQNFCDAPQELRSTIGTIAGVIFAVFDIFIAISTFKYVIALIDWARRN